MSTVLREPKDLPPVLIRITRTNPQGGTTATPYLNPGMSSEDAARFETTVRKGSVEHAHHQELKKLSQTLAVAGGTVAIIGGGAAVLVNTAFGHSPVVTFEFSPFMFAVVCAALLLVAAAVTGLRAAAWERRNNTGAVAPRSVADLTSLSSIDRYGHYDDAEQLILSLQSSRDAATHLKGDGRERVIAALLEALAILHDYATTIKPTAALRTSAHNAVDAVSIIARQEGAHL